MKPDDAKLIAEVAGELLSGPTAGLATVLILALAAGYYLIPLVKDLITSIHALKAESASVVGKVGETHARLDSIEDKVSEVKTEVGKIKVLVARVEKANDKKD